MDSMSSVTPAVPEAILQHLLVCKVVVFRPYGAELKYFRLFLSFGGWGGLDFPRDSGCKIMIIFWWNILYFQK